MEGGVAGEIPLSLGAPFPGSLPLGGLSSWARGPAISLCSLSGPGSMLVENRASRASRMWVRAQPLRGPTQAQRLPVSQWTPVKPAGHWQTKAPGRSLQEPPFLQGCAWHSSVSAETGALVCLCRDRTGGCKALHRLQRGGTQVPHGRTQGCMALRGLYVDLQGPPQPPGFHVCSEALA